MAFIKTPQKVIHKILENLKIHPSGQSYQSVASNELPPNSRSKNSGEPLAGRRAMYRATIKVFLLLVGSGVRVQKALPFHKRTFKKFL